VRKITARGYDEDLENFRERETKTGEERFLPSLNTVSVLKGGDCHWGGWTWEALGIEDVKRQKRSVRDTQSLLRPGMRLGDFASRGRDLPSAASYKWQAEMV